MAEQRIAIPGSDYPQAAGEQSTPLAADRQLTVSVILRPQPDLDAGVSAVEDFARQYGLSVQEASAPKRTVKVSGTVNDLERAFGVQLAQFGDHVGYRGPITLPASLADRVLAVLGLDTHPAARPRRVASQNSF